VACISVIRGLGRLMRRETGLEGYRKVRERRARGKKGKRKGGRERGRAREGREMREERGARDLDNRPEEILTRAQRFPLESQSHIYCHDNRYTAPSPCSMRTCNAV